MSAVRIGFAVKSCKCYDQTDSSKDEYEKISKNSKYQKQYYKCYDVSCA